MTDPDTAPRPESFVSLVEAGDPDGLRQLLAEHVTAAEWIDDCCFADAPAVVHAANRGRRELVEVLLAAGADINARSSYWGRTIGVLDESPAEMREFLLGRGALPYVTEFVEAVAAKDVATTRELLEQHAELRAQIDSRWFSFRSPAIVFAKDRAMVELLLEHGASVHATSLHGFTALDETSREIVELLVSRGAVVSAHVAAEHGMIDQLRARIEADPSAAMAPGGDGKTPLHCASSPEIVDMLIDAGAAIDARCDDHRSTPLQYLVKNDAVRDRLVARGAHVDIFAAAYAGDVAQIDAELTRAPEAIHARNHQDGYDAVPLGSIYSWRLGFKLSPHQVAHAAGHDAAYRHLMDCSPVAEQLINACLCGDPERAHQIAREQPDLVPSLPERDATRFADAAWCGNTDAVQVMLELGFDVDTPYDEGPALMGPCLFGNLELVDLLIGHGADLTWRNTYGSGPLGVAVWASKNFRADPSDYPGCVRRLLAAGLAPEPWMAAGGSEAVAAVLAAERD